MAKNLTLIFNKEFNEIHLGKDVFLVPYYLGKLLKYNVTIVYPQTDNNLNLPKEHKGVKLKPLTYKYNPKAHYLHNEKIYHQYTIKHAKKIDLLMCFHHNFQTELIVLLYKLYNSNGKVYIKLDVNPNMIEYKSNNNFISKKIHDLITKFFIHNTNIASCETQMAYENILKSKITKNQWGNKLELINNGFDEENLRELDIEECNLDKKENIFITVSRIGAYEKNSELILKALSKIDLKNWKFYFIGPIENDFKNTIKTFFTKHPDKVNNIIFTGAIYDKKLLWEFYNRAKVFVFASRWESYGLVFNEAKRFKNYIVSTPVGAFFDITENNKYGISYNENSVEEL